MNQIPQIKAYSFKTFLVWQEVKNETQSISFDDLGI